MFSGGIKSEHRSDLDQMCCVLIPDPCKSIKNVSIKKQTNKKTNVEWRRTLSSIMGKKNIT